MLMSFCICIKKQFFMFHFQLTKFHIVIFSLKTVSSWLLVCCCSNSTFAKAKKYRVSQCFMQQQLTPLLNNVLLSIPSHQHIFYCANNLFEERMTFYNCLREEWSEMDRLALNLVTHLHINNFKVASQTC